MKMKGKEMKIKEGVLMFNHDKLKCYGMSLEVAKRIPGLVARWPGGTHYLVDQLRRAVSSVVLNISEGNGRVSLKDRARFFAMAKASASESASCLDVALALRLISEPEAFAIKNILLQIVKMLSKLR